MLIAVTLVAWQAGLSPQLRTLVDLEALLNDGSAFVCFELLRVSPQLHAAAHGLYQGLAHRRSVSLILRHRCGIVGIAAVSMHACMHACMGCSMLDQHRLQTARREALIYGRSSCPRISEERE